MSKSPRRSLLCICFEYAPLETAGAIGWTKLIDGLSATYDVRLLTVDGADRSRPNIDVTTVPFRKPRGLSHLCSRLQLDKLNELFVFPDDRRAWIGPAVAKAMEMIRDRRPDAIVVFMMPYSAGLVGKKLKRLTNLPVLLNLNDSLTCSDMHPFFPSRLHYSAIVSLENSFAYVADAVVYVSDFNMRMVRDRLPVALRSKLHLVRCAADPIDTSQPVTPADNGTFSIVYIGGMNGWYKFPRSQKSVSVSKRLFRFWTELGRHYIAHVDTRGSSPVFIGKAVAAAIADQPDWRGRLRVKTYGNQYPAAVVQDVLTTQGVSEVVEVNGPIPHSEAGRVAGQADLLFLTLPARTDGSAGGRISLKTYEYLMTDRPILAAVPRGENWNYLEDKPGVWLVDPTDVEGMSKVVKTLAARKFAGEVLTVDRSHLAYQLSYERRVAEFGSVVEQMIDASVQKA